MLRTVPEEIEENEYCADWYSDFIRPDEPSNEPMSGIIYPVIDRIDSVITSGDNYDPAQYNIVATVATSFYWREVVSSVLPPGHIGLVVVFENPCNPSFTYQIK
jgi:hypothetical protein